MPSSDEAVVISDRPATVDVLTREQFLDLFEERYAPGQHVTLLGPTQRGKTTLCHQMLARVATPEHKAVLLAGKPPGRDPVMGRAAERLNLRIVEEWPPAWHYKDRKNNGYVLRPRQTMRDLKADKANVREHFRRAMVGNYSSRKPVITVCDEAHLIQNEYKLKEEYEAPLMRGAPVNAQWSLIQRGRYMSYLAYDAPEWFLIAYDPDVSNQRRYAEIGGVDPAFVLMVLRQLQTERGNDGRATVSEFLCIQRSGPELFIVATA